MQTPCPTLRVRVVGGMDTLPEEYLAEGLTKEEVVGGMGALF